MAPRVEINNRVRALPAVEKPLHVIARIRNLFEAITPAKVNTVTMRLVYVK